MNDEQIFLTKCRDCGKRIAVMVTKEHFHHELYTCNQCVPKDSSARNGIDECYETDLFDEFNL